MTEICSMNSVDQIADTMVNQHSFDYCSFTEARHCLVSDLGSIEFDRFTLCIYQTTLSPENYSQLISLLKKKMSMFRKAAAQERSEYVVLLRYFEIMGIPDTVNISKKEQPDFVCIIDGVSVGIEITRMEQELTAIMDKIVVNNFGRGLTANEIKNSAKKKFGDKADLYCYTDLQTTTKGVCAIYPNGISDINKAKVDYAAIIDSKLDKYKVICQDYEKFIILCDGMQRIAITDEKDAGDIIALVQNPIPSRIQIDILYDNSNAERSIYHYTLRHE